MDRHGLRPRDDESGVCACSTVGDPRYRPLGAQAASLRTSLTTRARVAVRSAGKMPAPPGARAHCTLSPVIARRRSRRGNPWGGGQRHLPMDRHGRARPRDDEGREERACCVLLAKGTAAWERRHPCLHTPLTARAGPAIRNAAWKAALPGVRAHGSGRATGIAAPASPLGPVAWRCYSRPHPAGHAPMIAALENDARAIDQGE